MPAFIEEKTGVSSSQLSPSPLLWNDVTKVMEIRLIRLILKIVSLSFYTDSAFTKNCFRIITGKVMFLHLCVILFRGGGLCPGGLCPGGDLHDRDPPYGNVRVVHILPECILGSLFLTSTVNLVIQQTMFA